MGGRRREIPPCCKRYGLPLYCASWVPFDQITPSTAAAAVEEEEKEDEVVVEEEEEEEKDGAADQGGSAVGGDEGSAAASPKKAAGDELMLVLGGGGGEGRSGVPNALLLSRFDLPSRSLSDEPVFRLRTGGEVPYRMAVHPGGDGLVYSFPNSCRCFEWDLPQSTESHELTLKSPGQILTQLEDVGLQLALAYNREGSLLATGGEDGHLRIFKWPSMEVILDQSNAHTSVKDLDFSCDGKFLVSLGSSGPCRVWDLTSATAVASLARENGEKFGFCRFSQSTDNNQILYITAMQGQLGRILSWSPLSWKRIRSTKIVRDPISAFSVSNDGKLFAIGTIEGDVVIVNSSDMQVHTMVKKAHLGLVTTLVFQDSRALVSASFDASARVTLVEDKQKNGMSLWVIIFIILLAILVYFLKANGVLQLSFPYPGK